MNIGTKLNIVKISLDTTPESYDKLIDIGYKFIKNYRPSKYWYRHYSILKNSLIRMLYMVNYILLSMLNLK